MAEQLSEVLARGRNMVFFGGAGVSTESGIPDYRSEDGRFQAMQTYGRQPEELVSHSYFVSHPAEFYQHYRGSLVYKDAQPNPAHRALARLEELGKLRAIVTQNVDGLHQKAGSKRVCELHGSIQRNYCMRCGERYPLEHILEPGTEDGIPRCTRCGGTVRPDVVLYEEALDQEVMNSAVRAIRGADVLIVGGTSLVVVPAALLIDYFQGDTLVLINRTATPYDSRADLVIRDPIGETLQAAVEAMEAAQS